MVSDITPMVEISQRAGIPVEVYAFIGSSPIRQYVENWDVELIAKRSAEAIDVAVKHDLPVAFVGTAGDERVQRRSEAEAFHGGRDVVHHAVRDEDDAGEPVRRHVG